MPSTFKYAECKLISENKLQCEITPTDDCKELSEFGLKLLLPLDICQEGKTFESVFSSQIVMINKNNGKTKTKSINYEVVAHKEIASGWDDNLGHLYIDLAYAQFEHDPQNKIILQIEMNYIFPISSCSKYIVQFKNTTL